MRLHTETTYLPVRCSQWVGLSTTSKSGKCKAPKTPKRKSLLRMTHLDGGCQLLTNLWRGIWGQHADDTRDRDRAMACFHAHVSQVDSILQCTIIVPVLELPVVAKRLDGRAFLEHRISENPRCGAPLEIRSLTMQKRLRDDFKGDSFAAHRDEVMRQVEPKDK